MPGIPPPPAIAIIILRASKNRSTSWLTVADLGPEPFAIRARREPSMIFGLARSAGRHRVDDRLDPVDLALVEVLELVLELAHARAASR